MKYISFASYDGVPMEFYFNCSSSINMGKKIKTFDTNRTEIKAIPIKSLKLNSSSIPSSIPVKTNYSNPITIIDLVNLAIGILSLATNMVQLYCMYLFSKYLDS